MNQAVIHSVKLIILNANLGQCFLWSDTYINAWNLCLIIPTNCSGFNGVPQLSKLLKYHEQYYLMVVTFVV